MNHLAISQADEQNHSVMHINRILIVYRLELHHLGRGPKHSLYTGLLRPDSIMSKIIALQPPETLGNCIQVALD